MYCTHFLVLFSLLFCFCESSKILAVFPMPAYSHYAVASTLLKELAKRGHEVTVVSPYPQKTPIENFKDISVESIIDTMTEQKKRYYEMEKQTVPEIMSFIFQLGAILTVKVLENDNVQKLLHSEERYDLVIVSQMMNEGLLGIAHYFEVPVVLVSPMPLFAWSNFQLAHPTLPSYVPNLLGQYTGHMNFWQRLLNSFHDAYSTLYHQWVILPTHREFVRKYIPGQPDLYDFLNNASLILINSHMSTSEAFPQAPNAIEIGGLHLKEPRALPEELQKFLDDSDDGVIIFSMGSNLKSSDLPQLKINATLKALAKLKERVLWKWEMGELPGLPKNVRLMKWLPQSDILAHPNVKAFITHGGLLSLMESIYHGVPVIGIPIYADQKMNIATAVSYGYGLVVPLQELTEKTLSLALNQVLRDPKYKDTAQKRSKIMRDQPTKPLDTAIYWIEYVIRHQGAPHLRYPGMDLAWYQRNLLDVTAFVIVSVSLVFIVFKQILKKIYKTHSKSKKE